MLTFPHLSYVESELLVTAITETMSNAGGSQTQALLLVSKLAGTSHPRATWHPTGDRIAVEQLAALQADLRALAHDSGFPRPLGGSRIAFDQAVIPILRRHAAMSPFEAAEDEVWNFVSLVLLPELVAWRFPNESGSIDYQRWLGGQRNFFRRLWWRAEIVGEDLAAQMMDDESKEVMERFTGGDRRLSRQLVATHLARYAEASDVTRTDLFGDYMKRIVRLAGVIHFGALRDEQLTALAEHTYTEAVSAARASEVQATATAIEGVPTRGGLLGRLVRPRG